MTEIDKWAAEQCGVEVEDAMPPTGLYYRKGSNLSDGRWTLNDARCREIFRKDWLSKGDRRIVITPHSTTYFDFELAADWSGRNEKACIKAIFENSLNNHIDERAKLKEEAKEAVDAELAALLLNKGDYTSIKRLVDISWDDYNFVIETAREITGKAIDKL